MEKKLDDQILDIREKYRAGEATTEDIESIFTAALELVWSRAARWEDIEDLSNEIRNIEAHFDELQEEIIELRHGFRFIVSSDLGGATGANDATPGMYGHSVVFDYVKNLRAQLEEANEQLNIRDGKLDLARQIAVGISEDELASQFGGLGWEVESPSKEIWELRVRVEAAEARVLLLESDLMPAAVGWTADRNARRAAEEREQALRAALTDSGQFVEHAMSHPRNNADWYGRGQRFLARIAALAATPVPEEKP